MSDFKIKTYTSSDKVVWDDFVLKSNQDSFLFQRDFMDYHSDRFQDFSLMVYNENKIIAVLPAHKDGDDVHSHKGLSYGGIIVMAQTRFNDYVKIVASVLRYLDCNSIKQFFVKMLPSIYNKIISEEWQYLAHYLNAKVDRLDSYFIIDNQEKYAPNRNRKRAIQNAKSQDIDIVNDNIEFFWEALLTYNLKHKFGVKPVHTIDEIKTLMGSFPNHIKYYATKINQEITAGVILFETDNVAHFQYSAGNDKRSETGSLDVLFHHIIKMYQHKKYISFGSSSTDKSLKINRGLMYWKESFGARLITQKTLVISPSNYVNLKALFND